MKRKFTILIPLFFILALFMGFMKTDGIDPKKGKQNTDSKLVNYNFTPKIEYRSPNAILKYVDSLDGVNTIAGLEARGYKTYYRSGGSPGITAIWYQGDPTSIGFPAYNGPTTGFVQADYNCVTGANNIDNWLVLPKLNISTGDSLFFYSGAYNSATYFDSIRVMYSAAGDSIPEAASWVELGRFLLTSYEPSLVVPWAQNGFRAATSGANARFAIRYCVADGGPTGANSSTIGIDYIRVISSAAYPLSAFNLQTPTAGVTITSLPGSTTPVSISWDTSATGATYKWKYVSTSGTSRSLTIAAGTNSINTTLGAIDILLAGIGLNQGDSTIGQWDVWAYKAPAATGPDSLKSTNGPRAITLKRQRPALTAFNLISPPTNTTITTQGGDNTPVISNWSKSGTGVTYKWKYASPNFSTPANVKIALPSNNAGLDSLLTTTKGAIDLILSALGVAMGDSTIGQWRVYAYSGTDSLAASSTFNITFKRATVVTIGTGTISSNFPFTTFWKDGRTQYLYLASELNLPSGYIAQIGFDVITADPAAMNGFKVSMQNTSLTTMTDFVTTGWYTAFAPTSYILPGTGWQMITLASPFYYTAGSNLLIEVCYNNTAYTQYSPVNSTTAPGMFWGRYYDLTDPAGGCETTVWALTTAPPGRANTRFTINPGPTLAGNEYSDVPSKYTLFQNYPNPFNPVTKINFAIPKQGLVTLKIYDILGREVRTLVNQVKTPGNYAVDFNGSELSSGVYFYRLQSAEFTDIKRMLMIK